MKSKLELLDILNISTDIDKFSPNEIEFSFQIVKNYTSQKKPLVILVSSLYKAQVIYDCLTQFIDKNDVNIYSDDEIFRLDNQTSSNENYAEKLTCLYSLLAKEEKIFIINLSAYIRFCSAKALFLNKTFNIRKDSTLDRNKLENILLSSGYTRVNSIDGVGQFAIRGVIFDVFSPNYSEPIRLELFDDEVDDIRFFNLEEGITTSKIDKVTIIPNSLYLLTNEDKEMLLELLNENKDNIVNDNDFDYHSLIEFVKRGYLENKYKLLYSLCKHSYSTICDYIEENNLIIFDKDDIRHLLLTYSENEKTLLKEIKASNNLYKDTKLAIEYSKVEKGLSKSKYFNTEFLDINLTTPPYVCENIDSFVSILNTYFMQKIRVILLLEDPILSNIKEILNREKIEYSSEIDLKSNLIIIDSFLPFGIFSKKQKLVILSTSDIYGVKTKKSNFFNRFKNTKAIKKYDELEIGDYVVHEDCGVGQYDGLYEKNDQSYIKIKYAKEFVLYVPIEDFRRIRKYCGREGYEPPLDSGDRNAWQRKKNKIKQTTFYMADQLINLYSQRALTKGFSYKAIPELEHLADINFPYQLTPSQERVIEEVYEDLGKEYCMDRLVAGDVGFGKTEVALRAAYRVILNNKQVAFLCPTTILAKQHFDVSQRRFQNLGLKIELLTRFQSVKQVNDILKRLANGEINLVIGTHKLLSDKIKFQDLGLLIVDEEQRFGVKDKEKIKVMSSNVDVLTLSATPIPRTLQLSLMNLRSLSLLDEAPTNRIAVKSYVCSYDENLIKEVVQRELARKGQVFYLSNDVRSMSIKIEKLKKLFPLSTIAMVHGQMSGDDIEEVMSNFYDKKIDILLCSTIIESGIDIPNANTIIVEGADRMGLGQLYQIKGRVGRSDRLAYCFFIYDNLNKVTLSGLKRLQALKEFTELGSGLKIASQDLKIRGAGDMLGKKQSGHIDTLGFEAYSRLLKEAIKQRKEQAKEFKIEDKNSIFYENENYRKLSFSVDATIPKHFMSDVDRINSYRELGNIQTIEELSKFGLKLRDIYGPLPEEVKNLIVKKRVEIFLNKYYVSSFVETFGNYELSLIPNYLDFEQFKILESKLESLNRILKLNVKHNGLFFKITRDNEYLKTLDFILTNVDRFSTDNNQEELDEEQGDSI